MTPSPRPTLPRGPLPWLALATLLLATTPPRAEETVEVDAGATITEVKAEGDALHVTVDRGSDAGLAVGMSGLAVHPMRKHADHDKAEVDFDVRVARGEVIEATPKRAVLSLEAVAGEVHEGDDVSYTLRAPPVLAASPLFRVTASRVHLQALGAILPMTLTSKLLADPTEAHLARVRAAMVAELRRHAELARQVYAKPIERGRFHGKTLSQVLDGATEDDVRAFLAFVDGYPGRYVGYEWNLVDVFSTWVINETPTGERQRKLRETEDRVSRAGRLLAEGDLDGARALYKQVLEILPDHDKAKEGLERVRGVELARRKLADDPDDTATRFELMKTLYQMGAQEQALAESAALLDRGYKPETTRRYRAYILTRMERWGAAVELLTDLTAAAADDESLADWLAYAKARRRLAEDPTDPEALLALARIHEGDAAWGTALTRYRQVLDHATDEAHLAPARQAQERIALRQRLEQRVEWAQEDVDQHDGASVREKVEVILALAEQIGDPERADEVLEDLSDRARQVSERDLALELMRRRLDVRPGSIDAHGELAFALSVFLEWEEAVRVCRAGLALEGDVSWLHMMLSEAALFRGDWKEAGHEARAALVEDDSYAWPYTTLARVAAARGDWEEAVEQARRGLEHDDDALDIRTTWTEANRGREAAEALAADGESPRERLRLVRALARLGLVGPAKAAIAKLPDEGDWRREAWWAIAEREHRLLAYDDRLEAARHAAPVRAHRKRELAVQEAQARLRAEPDDEAARLRLGRLLLEQGIYHEALAAVGPLRTESPPQAVADLVRDAREGIEADRLLPVAREAIARGNDEVAEQLARKTQAWADRVGVPIDRVRAREVRGDALTGLGRWDEAIALMEEAVAIARADGNALGLSIAERRLASYHSSIGRLDAECEAQERALELSREAGDIESLYYVHLRLADLEGAVGNRAGNVAHAREGWKMARLLGRKDYSILARRELADAQLASGRLTEADRLAEELLEDAREAEDQEAEQVALMIRGAVALKRGDGETARALFHEVYELGTRSGETAWRALARYYEGKAWLRADHEPAKAAAVIEEAAKLYAGEDPAWASAPLGDTLRLLAEAYLEGGEPERARQAAERGLKLAERYERLTSIGAFHATLARIALAQKRAKDAVEAAGWAVEVAKQTDDHEMRWVAWHALGNAREMHGDDGKALDAYEHAVKHLGDALQAAGGDDSQREGYLGTGRARDVYRDAIDLMLRMGKTKRAMELLEVSRDAQLRRHFDPARIEAQDPELARRIERYEAARARVQSLEQQLGKAREATGASRNEARIEALHQRVAASRQELNQVVLDLKLANRRLFQALSVDPQNLVSRRGDLPDGAVVVQYFIAKDALYVFVISADQGEPEVVKVEVDGETLERTVKDFREAIIDIPELAPELARRLHGWLLAPIEPSLKRASTVLVMPFGPLYYVPFGALVSSPEGEPLRFAIEDHRLTIQTATTLEHVLGPPSRASEGTLLAFANPDGTLPGAVKEVERIVRDAVPDARVLKRDAATGDSFRSMAGRFRHLHLATHGVLDPDPRKTHLKMADGPLTVHQIAGLSGLAGHNEMVVLSACQTALEVGASTGDELVSLAFAFSMAGAPSLVASLWKVDDISTAELMAAFYRRLGKPGADRLDALRHAQLRLLRMERDGRKPFADPWFWAGFQLYGDYRAPTSTAAH